MNSRQEAKLSMYRAVQLHCNSNLAIINTNEAFTAAFAVFISKITLLLGSESVVSKQTKGEAKDKGSLKTILCQTATDLAALVFAYGNKTKNETLKQQVNYSFTDLDRIADDLIVPACTNIYNAANTNLAALATYGVTAPMLAAIQTSMTNYSDSVPKPQNTKATKKTENTNIKETIKEVDNVLKNEMDKLVVSYKTANPNFVETYFNVRVIIDPKSITKKVIPTTDTPK